MSFPCYLEKEEFLAELQRKAFSQISISWLIQRWLFDHGLINGPPYGSDRVDLGRVSLLRNKDGGSLEVSYSQCQAYANLLSQASIPEKTSKKLSGFSFIVSVRLTLDQALSLLGDEFEASFLNLHQTLFKCMNAAFECSPSLLIFLIDEMRFKPGKDDLTVLKRQIEFFHRGILPIIDGQVTEAPHLRLIHVDGYDTKYFEKNGLHMVQFAKACGYTNDDSDGRSTADFFKLKEQGPRVRFRSLDEDVRGWLFADYGDIEVDATVASKAISTSQFSRILIVENRTTYLSLPPTKDTLLIYGAGFSVLGWLGKVHLAGRKVVYSGDLDYAGYKILACGRRILPGLISILMDKHSLLLFGENHVVKDMSIRNDVSWVPFLTESEKAGFECLGGRRLEQEFIPSHIIKEALLSSGGSHQ